MKRLMIGCAALTTSGWARTVTVDSPDFRLTGLFLPGRGTVTVSRTNGRLKVEGAK